MTDTKPPLPEPALHPAALGVAYYTQEQMHAYADAAVAKERARYIPLMQAVEWLLADGHMDQEHLARLRAAWEAT